jgi:hypothetical protein
MAKKHNLAYKSFAFFSQSKEEWSKLYILISVIYLVKIKITLKKFIYNK